MIYWECLFKDLIVNFVKLCKMWFLVLVVLLGMLGIFVFFGNWIIGFFYDFRYMLFGGVFVFVVVL